MNTEITLSESTFVITSVTLRHHLDDHGDPWFVAKDVCDFLEIANPSDACAKIPDEDKGIGTTDTLGGLQGMITVNEPGLYRLIFMSRKPQAQDFQRWVFRELLPSLRRNGYYKMRGRALPGAAIIPQPILAELRKRALTQQRGLEAVNGMDLANVPEVPWNHYQNAINGRCRPSRALAVRAGALFDMSASELFTKPPRSE
jgi:prophage antirepressor-like protein